MISDSGERTEYDNGFVRDMGDMKGRMDLLPWRAIRRVSIHCEEGAKKYGERNIDKGAPQWSLYSSGLRHWSKVIEADADDPEDMETHMTAAVWNGLWALEQILKEKENGI